MDAQDVAALGDLLRRRAPAASGSAGRRCCPCRSRTGGSRPRSACRTRARGAPSPGRCCRSRAGRACGRYRPRAFEYSFLFQRAGAQVGDVVGHAAIERQQQRERELGDGNRVLARAVRHVDAALGRGRDVDGVVAGAGAHDERQRPGLEHRRRSPRCCARPGRRRPCPSSPASACRLSGRADTTTSQPAAFRPSMPHCSNLSATRLSR